MSLVGNLEDLGLGDILQIVSLSRKSGKLTLKWGEREGGIVFRNGQVIQAQSTAYRAHLGDVLLNKSLCDLGTMKKALALHRKLGGKAPLQDLLVERFEVPRVALEEAVKEQVEKIAYSFFGWSGGTFSFEVGEMSNPEKVSANPFELILEPGLNPQWLAMEGSRLLDEKIHRGEPVAEEESLPGMDMEAFSLEEANSSGLGASTSLFNLGAELLREFGDEPEKDIREKGPESPGLYLLKGMLQELGSPSLGGGITLLVLRFASELMNRAVIFMVKEKEIVGLGQFGMDGIVDAKIRRMKILRDEGSSFEPVLREMRARKLRLGTGLWDGYLREQLGGEDPEEVFLGPIISEGRVVAIIYGDNLPERTPVGDTESFEIFLSQAGLAMEKALLERRLKGMNAV